VPAGERGAASGMRVTFGNAGMPLSMGLFFTLMVVGLNAKVPAAMMHGLVSHGVSASVANQLSHLPPLGYLFASLLGYNPLGKLLGPQVLSHLPAHQAAVITSRSFFPSLIGGPFKHGLVLILSFAVAMSLIAAVASALRGKRFVHAEAGSTIGNGHRTAPVPAGPSPAAAAGNGATAAGGAVAAEGPAAGNGATAGDGMPDGGRRGTDQAPVPGPGDGQAAAPGEQAGTAGPGTPGDGRGTQRPAAGT
ncbi:MAG: MFS transporter, partial [Actinobacteria bacterium]|nr:MFS transporter [Actinomycetota bacterium]